MKTLPALFTSGFLLTLHASHVQAATTCDPQFASGLYNELRKGYGNVVISPHGVASSLAMLYGGAGGQTAAEMASILRVSGSPTEVHRAFARRDSSVNSGSMSFSSSLWMRQGHSFTPAFSSVAEGYKADLRTVDFAKSPESARQEINQWAVSASAGMPDPLLLRDDLNPRAELVLVSVSQLNAGLPGASVSPGQFQLEGGRSREVPMMTQTGDYRYADLGDVQLIEIPCAPAGQTMLIALPTDPNGLPALERKLSADPSLMSQWRKSLRPATVSVTLPKFKVVFNYNLNRALREMGMKTAFTSAADFSGVSGSQGLSATAVLHRTVVEFGEGGSSGSAKDGSGKDGLVDSAKGYVVPSAKSAAPAFNGDRPFLYSVGDGTGGDTFMGRMGDPGFVGPPGIWYGGRTNPGVPVYPTFPELKSVP